MKTAPQRVPGGLKKYRLFNKLTEKELDKVFDNLSHANVRKGAVVLKAGERSSTLYLIQYGSVSVKTAVADTELAIASLGAFEHFGDMALIDGGPSSATVETVEDCGFLLFAREDFLSLVEEEPAIGRKLWRALAEILSERMRRTTKTLTDYLKFHRALLDNKTFREFYRLCHS